MQKADAWKDNMQPGDNPIQSNQRDQKVQNQKYSKMIMLEIQLWMQSKLWPFIAKASFRRERNSPKQKPCRFSSQCNEGFSFFIKLFWIGVLAFWHFGNGLLSIHSMARQVNFLQPTTETFLECTYRSFFSIKDILVGNVPFSVTPHLTVVVSLKFWNICDILPFFGWKKKLGLLFTS